MRAILVILVIGLMGCCTSKKVPQPQRTGQSDSVAQFMPGPPALVYKTRGDYYHLVPILLSEDKKEIISYPHPKDLMRGNGYALPDSLSNGYLLDKRGINASVAFLSFTYDEYVNLQEVPTADQLYEKIVDKDPLTELCNCGLRASFSDPVRQINELIESGELQVKCKRVK